MKLQNGFEVYEPDEQPQLEDELSTIEFSLSPSPYGFKVIEVNGKKSWAAATKEDMREAESRRLGKTESLISLEPGCFSVSPFQCGGVCGDGHPCRWICDRKRQYCYCLCP